MRLALKFSKNTEPVSTINQHLVNGYIHTKCLKGETAYHSKKNDYCISHLYGGKLNPLDKTIDFSNGAFIYVTSQDEVLLNKIMIGVLNNPEFTHGMNFETYEFVKETFVDGWNHFATLSPFILRKSITLKDYKFFVLNDEKFLSKANDKTKERIIVLNDQDFSECITNHTKGKLEKMYPELNLTDFKIEVKNHPGHKIKPSFKEFDHQTKRCVLNFTNQCQISIFCSKVVAEKIYNIGIGQSTGSGFGTIYKTENHKKYR